MLIGIFHIGNFCFWVPFFNKLLLRNHEVNFVEICNVCARKLIIKAANSIINSDKMCHSYSDFNFGVTFFGTQCRMVIWFCEMPGRSCSLCWYSEIFAKVKKSYLACTSEASDLPVVCVIIGTVVTAVSCGNLCYGACVIVFLLAGLLRKITIAKFLGASLATIKQSVIEAEWPVSEFQSRGGFHQHRSNRQFTELQLFLTAS